MTQTMTHCDECDVCVDELDHHCVFFSKCIGEGNLTCFYGTIVMLVINIILIPIFVLIDGGISQKHAPKILPSNEEITSTFMSATELGNKRMDKHVIRPYTDDKN